ncbi:hypothetical protein A2765_00400 [Candidatus Kaiserbacteria bacterium RIFCSPHIGHO2_01_FULL_56_24]|uniref:UDP-glucose/GDP-mannose dehydrogenase dimerisation domain-containing protein n=1 Tax=Candidatus Kaiserbacteria bacterium RIFCSPHIGHO2_01_FULL_56_24 TaxID=1798487 RepID=A0A1F6DBY4_9BACT|nr:MAG: hypothetical protein A2765_00400 [Candidatus Kaiserbacteria bacterium RIFCSPHIGHO2_01_FULL_56_24]
MSKAKTAKKPLIGFVGQGFVGKNYADNFEDRGYKVIRYALEEPYRSNKDKIKETDIVFVCVPTPTTPKGFDASIVEEGLKLVGRGKIAVIKSTMLVGMTRKLQKKFPDITVLCSPEFLSVATAREDSDNPFSNIVGMPSDGKKHKAAAELVHSILPNAPFAHICMSEEAELIKYAHNFNGYTQILAFNVIYDLADHFGCDWEQIESAVMADPYIPTRYAKPKHKSGRGAGGACFIKDVAALSSLYQTTVKRPEGVAFLKAAEKKNMALLLETNKDRHLLEGVYGPKAVARAHAKTAPKRKKR